MSGLSAPAIGSAISSVMVAVRPSQTSQGMTDAQLQAVLQRVAMQLYAKAHLESPPTATDWGGGIYNILV
jgi:hypothetical protein